ncbi:MmgE/PrpD family protein [Microbacteriaceae bacterium K1510]|nr:MmgE/PrpD family protein [Microbacteriaceae bacterium K1510]
MRCDTLPADVEAKARLLLLDTLGCLLAGLNHPDVKAFGRALGIAFPGEVAWPASDIKLAPAGSAALGAAAACWDEACEGNASAHGRPGLPVVPALLALAATHDTSLGDLLLALVTGYEIGTRAGEAWRIPAGWHVDGSSHSLGVAAAVARLTAGPQRMQAAIEAAASQIPASLYLPITVGSVLRNTYPAHGALLGILAAAAAEAGFPMPTGTLEEGRRRILRTVSDAKPTPAGHWTIMDGYLKPFAAVRHTHYGVAAALRLRQHPAFSLAKIGSIRLQVYDEAMRYCGNRAPRTAIQAQFSLSYAVAAALVLGDLGPEAYTKLDDPAMTELERRIVVEVDPQRTQRGATLTLDIDGTSLSETVDAVAGDPSMPMTRDDTVSKFHRYVDPIIGRPHAEALVAFALDASQTIPARQCFSLGRA